MFRAHAFVALAGAILVSGCGGSSEPPPAAEPTSARVVELASVERLARAFTAADGKARLLLLLSPT